MKAACRPADDILTGFPDDTVPSAVGVRRGAGGGMQNDVAGPTSTGPAGGENRNRIGWSRWSIKTGQAGSQPNLHSR